MGNKQSKIRPKEKKSSDVSVPSNVGVSSDVKVTSMEENSNAEDLSNESNAATATSIPAAAPVQAEIATPARVPSPPLTIPIPAVPSAPLIPYLPLLITIRDHYKLHLEIFALDVMKRAERGEASILRRTVDGVECRIVKVWYNPEGQKPQRVVVIEKGDAVEGYEGRKEWEVVFLDGEQVGGDDGNDGQGEGEQAAEEGRTEGY
ncbi:hypothetical protein B0J14DRAFT_559747 [Halenospora varia]|nr:hypothetical protein B0J14DRAFT_559747 [Halenospora varia]